MGIQQLHQELRGALARQLHISALTDDDRASVEVLLARADQLEAQLSPYAGEAPFCRVWLTSMRELATEAYAIIRRYSEKGSPANLAPRNS